MTEQEKREKVIKGLEQYKANGWTGLNDYYLPIVADALALLKAQEPRLVTSKDFESNPNVDDMGGLPAWIEYRRDSCYENILKDCRDGWCIVTAQAIEDSHSMRCWTSRPTNAQREATPWGK